MDNSNIIKDTLTEELDRNIRSQRAYESERSKLPRGSVTVRQRGNNAYCYLRYRDNKKIVTEYVGPAKTVKDELSLLVERRKKLEEVIKRLKREEQFIRKALKHS